MPSDNEIKQIMTEKVFPFFDGGGLDEMLARLEALEGRMKKIEKENTEPSQKKIKKARQAINRIVGNVKPGIKEADVKATIKLNDTGRAEVAE